VRERVGTIPVAHRVRSYNSTWRPRIGAKSPSQCLRPFPDLAHPSDVTSFAIDVPPSLIARLKGGDMRAFEQVYRLFERPVYTLAYRVLGDADEAQEILHDAMLALFDKCDQYRGDSPFWGWLRQIALNEALQRVRKRRLDYVETLPEPEATRAAQLPAIEAQDLERAMEGLPQLTRSVLWLYFAEGYTHEEIATSFGKTTSFSKTQVLRGTQKLRQLLDVSKERLAYA
jgi:RNA polymerase sigma factor (sigma-70 family)